MRQPIERLPADHREVRGRFLGVTGDGVDFDLEVASGRRRASSGDLVKAHVRSMSRGMPITSRDLYTEVEEVVLRVGRQRLDVTVNTDRSYRIGRGMPRRSLREAVAEAIATVAPRARPAASDAPAP
jgi:hypothetical protein